MFIDHKLAHITNILSKEKNKKVYIAGDFNFDLLKYSNHDKTADFYDKMTSNLLVPLILIPTKINTKMILRLTTLSQISSILKHRQFLRWPFAIICYFSQT